MNDSPSEDQSGKFSGEKAPYQSSTIVASAVVIVASVASLLGVAFTDGDEEALTQIISSLVAAVAGAKAWHGRVKATRRIKRSPGL